MRWLFVAVFLIGCADGVVLDVETGNTGADRVVMFLGTQSCEDEDCGGVWPKTAAERLAPGDVYYRDGAVRPVEATVDGGHAYIQLLPGELSYVKGAIVVGLKGDTVVGVTTLALETDQSTKRLIVTLEPAAPASLQDRTNGTFVHLWNTADAVCAVVEYRRTDAPKHVSVLPKEDPDCDGVPLAQECKAVDNVYLFTAPPATKLVDMSCLRSFPTGPATTCRLGSGCMDGMPTKCAPSNACFVDPTCACGPQDLGCVEDAAAGSPTALSCTIALGPNGTVCSTTPQNAYLVDLPPIRTAMRGCTQIRFLGFNAPAVTWDDIATELALPSGARLKVGDRNGLCDFSLFLDTAPVASNVTEVALVVLDTDHGRQLFLPLHIAYAPDGCGTLTARCTLEGLGGGADGDGLWACLGEM
jgi:hypothetical protein